MTAAGFVLEAESDVLDNPNDPHDVSPREVEPTSDKFALRFRKPGRPRYLTRVRVAGSARKP